MKHYIKNEEAFKEWKENIEAARSRTSFMDPEKYPCVIIWNIDEDYNSGRSFFEVIAIVYLSDFKEHIEELHNELGIWPSSDDDEAGFNRGIDSMTKELLK